MVSNPLLYKGFTSGWLQKFFLEPFDPLCVMLAMRTKLLLDAIDEMGHSYNLIRMIGFGWLDFGDVPGEEPGDPGNYYPPGIDNPIIVPPPPGDYDYYDYYYDPSAPGPWQPGYVPPGPGEPGFRLLRPGQPGYGSPLHGQPGYEPPTPAPGAGMAPAPSTGAGAGAGAPGGGGGPSGGGTGGGGGGGGGTGSMSAPSGFLDQGLWTGTPGAAGGYQPGIDCSLDKDDPTKHVHIDYGSLEINCGESIALSVDGYNPLCDPDIFYWSQESTQGSLTPTTGFQTTYTAPDGGADCITPVAIYLYVRDILCDSVAITINPNPSSASIEVDASQLNVYLTIALTANTTALGCGSPEWAWSLTSGLGSLSPNTGEQVIYTAPAPQPNVIDSVAVTLSAGGVVLATTSLVLTPIPVWADNLGVFTMTLCVSPLDTQDWEFDGFYQTSTSAGAAYASKLAALRAAYGSQYESSLVCGGGGPACPTMSGGIDWTNVNCTGFSKTWAAIGYRWRNYYFFYPKSGVGFIYDVA